MQIKKKAAAEQPRCKQETSKKSNEEIKKRQTIADNLKHHATPHCLWPSKADPSEAPLLPVADIDISSAADETIGSAVLVDARVRGASGPEALRTIANRLDITELGASAADKATGALTGRDVLGTLLPRALASGRQGVDHVSRLGSGSGSDGSDGSRGQDADDGRRKDRSDGSGGSLRLRVADCGISAAAAEAVDGADVELAAKGAVWVGGWTSGNGSWSSGFRGNGRNDGSARSAGSG
jgi:hypothetical protein